MSTYQVLILTQKAEVKAGKINVEENSTIKLENIQKYFKKKTEPELLGTYNYKQLTLFLFGFPKGKLAISLPLFVNCLLFEIIISF